MPAGNSLKRHMLICEFIYHQSLCQQNSFILMMQSQSNDLPWSKTNLGQIAPLIGFWRPVFPHAESPVHLFHLCSVCPLQFRWTVHIRFALGAHRTDSSLLPGIRNTLSRASWKDTGRADGQNQRFAPASPWVSVRVCKHMQGT